MVPISKIPSNQITLSEKGDQLKQSSHKLQTISKKSVPIETLKLRSSAWRRRLGDASGDRRRLGELWNRTTMVRRRSEFTEEPDEMRRRTMTRRNKFFNVCNVRRVKMEIQKYNLILYTFCYFL
jgi:hypothetical protein